jgi:hypothetical protein
MNPMNQNPNNFNFSSSPIINVNEMQRMYTNLLKKEYKEILGLHMTELMVLNYAHHVRNNDTYILRRDSHNAEVNGQIRPVSVFYISKTNLYSRPSNPTNYRFANMVAYKLADYPHVSSGFGFEQDDDYCIRILYDYTTVKI